MPRILLFRLRLLAAILVTCAGAARVASLWFRDLDEQAVLTLLTGVVYLIMGIGLFGQSRFALFVAAVTCSATSLLALKYVKIESMLPLQQAALAGDVVTAVCCILVFWQLRKEPSV